jgi:hypothetical protein
MPFKFELEIHRPFAFTVRDAHVKEQRVLSGFSVYDMTAGFGDDPAPREAYCREVMFSPVLKSFDRPVQFSDHRLTYFTSFLIALSRRERTGQPSDVVRV